MNITADIKPEAITAIIDTREQTPLDLAPLSTSVSTLDTGDYSIRGLEHHIAVERKSLPDLVACVGRERERFEREVMRLLAFPVRLLVVEASWRQIQMGGWRGQVKPKSVEGSLLGWQAMGLPVLLAGNHTEAGRAVSRLLYIVARREWRKLRTLAGSVKVA